MNTANDKPNVVDLQARSQGSNGIDRVGDLVKLVRTVSLARITSLVGTLFDNVDDALFDLAERAGSNAAQTEYFDGMREVRKKRQLVERLFNEQTAKAFTDFAAGKLKPIRPEVAAQPEGNGGLSLVDDLELEDSLAVSSMVAKAEGRLQRALFQVNQRLSVIAGGAKVEDASNPIGPAVLANAFRIAIREFDVNIQVKLIIYKLFDRYVMAGLEPIYDEVNAELIRAGVLPQIRHVAARGTRVAPPAPHGRTSGTAGAPGSLPDEPEVSGELQAELYQTLRSLLASRHGSDAAHEHAADGAGAGGGPGLSPTELLSALTILQTQSAAMQARAESVSDAAETVQQIKQELLEQVGKLSDDARARRVSTADEDTIDLVGMLFEYILEDRNLPAQMQALLGRLQIPYLKVAIMDKHLFAQKTHPARKLLDLLADAGKSWTEDADRDHRLYDRIHASVDTVLRDFDEDVDVFEREHASFSKFIEDHRRRAELTEQRAAEAARGRERLQEARRIAAREILARIENRNLPPVVHTVLARPWANYLVLTLLRQGENSDEWRSALRFADEFVWSAQPKMSSNDINRLRTLLPQLEKALRHGLATVAYHDSDVKKLMGELSTFYRRVLDGEKVETRSAKDVISEGAPETASGAGAGTDAPTTASQSPVEEVLLHDVPLEEPAAPPAIDQDDEYLNLVKEMKVGSWIEFIGEDDQRERAKLSWISPISSKYLFVNRRGLKVCDKTVAALAAELREGHAILLEEVPLFDRALDAIVARLRHAGAPEANVPGTPAKG